MKISARKAVAFAATAVFALGSLAACNRGASTTGGAGAEAGKSITIALSTQTNPFFVSVRNGAQKKADELGVKLNVQDASDDAAKQTDQLNNAATAGSSVVIVNPVDSDAVVPAVSALNKAKIPVVAVDRAVNGGTVASFIASDNVLGGKLAATALAKAVGEKGEVIVLQGTAGTSASRERGQGFKEGIAQYPNIKVVASQTANFDRTKGLDVATNLLQAHPNAVGIFAENDEMALGAVKALGARAGKSVFVVGFDGSADGLKAVQEGTLTATVAQQPELLGATAVETAVKILKGEKVQAAAPVEVVVVDKTNVAEHK
ncbi:MAG: substrate-binding domain-containing protein [Arcanobacterium sp.]|nr:substrate-binding domain-containing protein [Arcanobacterium sp.]MDY5589286.1 substrate-binding domain-containing protein [Arcanobacterium sp.]